MESYPHPLCIRYCQWNQVPSIVKQLDFVGSREQV